MQERTAKGILVFGVWGSAGCTAVSDEVGWTCDRLKQADQTSKTGKLKARGNLVFWALRVVQL